MKNRFLSLFIASVMVLGLLAFPATVAATTFDLASGTITVSALDGDNVVIEMSGAGPTANTIIVADDFDGRITLQGVNIETDGTVAPMFITSGAKVELFLVGGNYMTSGGNLNPVQTGVPVIFVPEDAELTINAERAPDHDRVTGVNAGNWTYLGYLEANGHNGNNSAVIGGTNSPLIPGSERSNRASSGLITINGGRVWAHQIGNSWAAAAIGSGPSTGAARVIINGGQISAFAGTSAAGIGNGQAPGQPGTPNVNAPMESFVILTGGQIRARGGIAIGADATGRLSALVVLPGVDLGTTRRVGDIAWGSVATFGTAAFGLYNNNANNPTIGGARNLFYMNRMNPGNMLQASGAAHSLTVEAWDADATIQAYADFSEYFGTNYSAATGWNGIGLRPLSDWLPDSFSLGQSVASGSDDRVWNLYYFNNIALNEDYGANPRAVFYADDNSFNDVVWNAATLQSHLGAPAARSVILSSDVVPVVTLSTFEFSTDSDPVPQLVPGWSNVADGVQTYQAALPFDAETLTLGIEATDDVNANVRVEVNWGDLDSDDGWIDVTNNLTDIDIENIIFRARVTVESGVLTSVFTVTFAKLPPAGYLDVSLGTIGGFMLGSGEFPISDPDGTYTIIQRLPGVTNNTITVPRGFRGEIILDGVNIQSTLANVAPASMDTNRAPILLSNFLHENPVGDRIDMTLTIRGENRLEGGTTGLNNAPAIFVPRDSAIEIRGYNNDDQGNILRAYGRGGAAIGGDAIAAQTRASGHIVIRSGTIHAQVLEGGSAAIGGGGGDNAKGRVTIYGGNITALAATNQAGTGIGGGSGAATVGNAGSRVIIHDGTVYARGGHRSPGIGNGPGMINDGQYGYIIINGGTVTASAMATGFNASAPGIGAAEGNAVGLIEINGGTIRATGGGTQGTTINDWGVGAGIGTSGRPSAVDTVPSGVIVITGGDITAIGAGNAPGIGGGVSADGTTVRHPIDSLTVLPDANLNGSTISGIDGDIFYFNPGVSFGIGGAGVNSRRLWIVAYEDTDENTEATVDFSAFGMGTINLGDSSSYTLGRIWRMNFFTNMTGSGNVNFETVDNVRSEELTAGYLRDDLAAGGRFVFMTEDSVTPPSDTTLPILPANPVERIVVNPVRLELPEDFVGDLELLTQVFPANATNQALNWVSSNEDVATVNADGNITVVGRGVANITAESTDNGGAVSNRFVLTVVESFFNDYDQLRNLPPVGESTGGWTRTETDVNYHLAMPTQVGAPRVALWRNNATAAFSVNVDDNFNLNAGNHVHWLYLTQNHGMPFTFFLEGWAARDRIGVDGAGWRALIASGSEIQSHTMYHLTNVQINALTSAQSLFEFQAAIPYIEAIANEPVRSLAFSFGTGIPAHSAWFYAATRGTGAGMNRANNMNYRLLAGFGDETFRDHYDGIFRAVLTQDALTPPFNQPNNFGGWVNVYYHGLPRTRHPEDQPRTWEGGRDELAGILASLTDIETELGVSAWRTTFTDIILYAQSRDTATIQVVNDDLANGTFSFNLTDRMADVWFDRPLTVNVKLTTDSTVGNDWQSIRVTQAGSTLRAEDVTVEVVNGVGTFASVNVVPDGGLVVIQQVDSWYFDDSTPGEVTVSLLDFDENVTLIVALYSVEAGGALRFVRMEHNTFLAAAADKSVTIDVPLTGAYRIRAFAWNSFGQMVSIYRPFEQALAN